MKPPAGRLLLVDDDEPLRALCVRVLVGPELSVDTAASAEEAWARLNEREYDCVLTDISMPGPMDGTALAEEIRGRFPSTDVLIMTGDPDLTTAVSTLRSGARDYLTKPFTTAALQAAVSRCFERRRLSADLDAERALRRELEAAYGELQKTEHAKDAFIARLNHELRTPLTVAIASAEMLADMTDPLEIRRVVTMLRSSLTRENEVIEELLLFSRLSSGALVIQSSEFAVEDMLRSLVEDFRSVWEEKRLSVEVACGGPRCIFRGDPALLRTAFRQLLLNAIRFNTKGGSVRIEARCGPGNLEVLFADTGIGVAPEARARVFDRFYQVAEHMTRKVGGLGLGLATVRRIVEAHGGVIRIEDREGGGSAFRISLPRAAAVAAVASV
jgi:signal transduction histidine kinase